jgi:hypothetical protein
MGKQTSELIIEVTDSIKELLLQKNEAYGDSALNPAGIFAKGSAVENLCSRIDDKLMRIKNSGINDLTEDTISDLIGYLILLKIAIQKSNGSNDLQGHILNIPTESHWDTTSTDPNIFGKI